MDKLPRDFRELFKLLNTHGVEYLLIGGYAVAYHGFERYTADLDIWIALDEANAGRIVAVLKEFGFDLPNLHESMFLDEQRIVRLGREPMRVEFLNRVDGLVFKEAYPNRVEFNADGLKVPIISLKDLRTNKKASGRSKDLADLDNLPDPG